MSIHRIGSSLQSMESSNQDLQNEIVRVRLQYKVSVRDIDWQLLDRIKKRIIL